MQEARTLKPNSWPETGAAVTATPGREEPSKRPAFSVSEAAPSLHARAVKWGSLCHRVNTSRRPLPVLALNCLGLSLGRGRQADAQLHILPRSQADWAPRVTPTISERQLSLPGPGFRGSSIWGHLAVSHATGRSRKPGSAHWPCRSGPKSPAGGPSHAVGSKRLGNTPCPAVTPGAVEVGHKNRSLKDVASSLNELCIHRCILCSETAWNTESETASWRR